MTNQIPFVEVVHDDQSIVKVTRRKGDTSSAILLTVNKGTELRLTKRTKNIPANIGVNLSDAGIYDNHAFFKDVVRSATTEQRHGFFTIGTWEPTTSVPLDDGGWPLSDFSMLMHAMPTLSSERVFNWRVIGHVGSINVPGGWSSFIGAYDSATNTQAGTVTMPAGTDSTAPYGISFVGTKRTPSSAVNTGLQKIQILRPGYTDFADAEANEFTSEIARVLGQFDGPLRMMDLQSTNGDLTPITEASRALPSNSPTRSKRIPDERVIALANHVGRDPWLHIPIAASDDYITGLAKRLKALLSPRLNVYVELSNEVWNTGGGFFQTRYAWRQGALEGKAFAGPVGSPVFGRGIVSLTRTSNAVTIITEEAHGWNSGDTLYYEYFGDAIGAATITAINATTATIPLVGPDGPLHINGGVGCVNQTAFQAGTLSVNASESPSSVGPFGLSGRWYTRRVKEISDLFRSVWGVEMDAPIDSRRVRIVLADQMSTTAFADRLDYLSGRWGAVNRYIWGIAGADYAFSNSLTAYGFGMDVASDPNPSLTQATIEGVLQGSMAFGWKYYKYEQRKAYCIKHGIKSMQYEMGTDTYDYAGTAGANNAKKTEATFAQAMQSHYREYIERFYKCGGDVVCWFHGGVHNNMASPHGSWSVFRLTPDDTGTAKIAAIRQIVAAGKPSGGMRNNAPGTVRGSDNYNADGGPNPTLAGDLGWLVYSATAGAMSLTIAYKDTGDDPKTVALSVNGVPVQDVAFPNRVTGDYTLAPITVTLLAGWNAIDLTRPYGWAGSKTIASLTFA